ncbi:MAG: hypothetical protein ABSD27_07130 [Bryobacteraceae bacterium]|jgi:hypothetical protein
MRQSGAPKFSKLAALLLCLLGAYVMVWLWFGRYHFLDDAFISLRYADMLLRHGYFTYDGLTRTGGASSPLYIFVLAAVQALAPSSLVPKLVSIFCYVLLLAGTLWLSLRARLRFRHWVLWVGLLLSLCGPMGVRWLTDGMETSLVAIAAVGLPVLITRAAARNPVSTRTALILTGVGAASIFLRVEFAYLLSFSAVALFAQVAFKPGWASLSCAQSRLLLGHVGALLLGFLSLYAVWGGLLPDTAVAKSAGPVPLDLEGLMGFIKVVGASGSLGAGVFILWAISAILALRSSAEPRIRVSTALINTALPLMCLLILARGQTLQGVRHLLWCPLFLLSWNICTLQLHDLKGSGNLRPAAARWSRVFVLLILALYCVESVPAYRILRGVGNCYRAMRMARLERLQAQTGVAYDIGFIGYFTGSRICDLSGLVNGRSVALFSSSERLRWCAEQRPGYAFLNSLQAADLTSSLRLEDWRVCSKYPSPKVRSEDAHYLLVAPAIARSVCADEAPVVSAWLKGSL